MNIFLAEFANQAVVIRHIACKGFLLRSDSVLVAEPIRLVKPGLTLSYSILDAAFDLFSQDSSVQHSKARKMKSGSRQKPGGFFCSQAV